MNDSDTTHIVKARSLQGRGSISLFSRLKRLGLSYARYSTGGGIYTHPHKNVNAANTLKTRIPPRQPYLLSSSCSMTLKTSVPKPAPVMVIPLAKERFLLK